jgi:hypothetical protein
MALAYIKVLVNLKLGMIFVGFFKIPNLVPLNNEGTMIPKSRAHYIVCDEKGNIHSISKNCIYNLGIPPILVSRPRIETHNFANIDQFSPKIISDLLFEFDLPKGT